MSAYRRIQIDTYLSTSTKLMSECIKDLNIKPDTVDMKEEEVRISLELTGTGDDFLKRMLIS